MISNRTSRAGLMAALIAVEGLVIGCVRDRAALSPKVDPDQALGAAVITPRNALLSVGGTLQLSMTATVFTGGPATQIDSVSYGVATLSDTARLRVTRDGLMTGLSANTTAPVPVNVLAFWHGTVVGDQALVQITPTALTGLTLSIQPSLGDSAKQASGTAKTIVPVVRNPTTGASVSSVQMQYEVKSADMQLVGVFGNSIKINPAAGIGGVVRPVAVGTPQAALNQIVPYVGQGSAWVYATLNAYGTPLKDSVQYTFTYPYTGTIATTKTNLAVMTSINGGTPLSPGLTGSVTLAPGAIITFSNGIAATDPLTVGYSFDNPAAATAPAVSPSTTGGASGNVTPLTGGQNSRRQFLVVGTYRWTKVTAGGPAPWPGQTFTGTIVIK